MCANCGCQSGKTTLLDLQTGETTRIAADHQHASGSDYSHDHDHDHTGPHDHVHHRHHHAHDSREHAADHHGHGLASEHRAALNTIDVESRILAKNDQLAAKNRAWFAGREILALNLVSSPGAGKTALLERTIRDLAGELPLCVIEGDQATANDGERIRKAGAAVVQVNTGTGCHLDAAMVTRALSTLKPGLRSLVLIENVGNLVCPALFDLGERAKVVMFPVTDGEDKPLKYPHIFRAAGIVILSKIDLLPNLDFALSEAIDNVAKINPAAAVLQISARSGQGMTEWYDWLRNQFAAAQQSAFA